MTSAPRPDLPALSDIAFAHLAIDKIWAAAEAENRPATVAEANEALQLLATAIGLYVDPDGAEGDPLISLALDVARTLRDALAYTPSADDPAAEYERILRSAEQEALRNPEAGHALANIADRWLAPNFTAARNLTADRAKPTGRPLATAPSDAPGEKDEQP